MKKKFAIRLSAATMTPTVRAKKLPLNTPIPASSMTNPTIRCTQPPNNQLLRQSPSCGSTPTASSRTSGDSRCVGASGRCGQDFVVARHDRGIDATKASGRIGGSRHPERMDHSGNGG